MKSFSAGLTKSLLSVLAALILAPPALAKVTLFPRDFRVDDIVVDGATIPGGVGGKGPAVVMLHGFGDTGDMWAPVAAALAKNHPVVVPDLRGMGLSSHPDMGYTKTNQAVDIAGMMDALKIERAD